MISAFMNIAKQRSELLFLGLLICLFSLIASQSVSASDDRTAELIAGAKKEGKLIIYTSLSISDVSVMVNKFQAKYPFVKVEYTRTGGEGLITRIMNEARANRYIPDIIQTGTFELYMMKNKGLLAKYASPERKAYDEQFRDAEGFYTAFFFTTKPTLYNTKLVPPNKVPKSYEDLLDPQWKGKLALEGGGGSASGIRWYMSVMNKMGEQKGEAFMRELAKQKVALRSGTTLIAMLVAAGEYPIAVVSSGHLAESLIEKKAPVDWVRNDPMYTTHTGISLSAHAPSPNSAKLYIDFLLSKEGQEVLRDMHRIPARSDVEPDPPRLRKGIKLFPYNPEWSDDYERYAKKYNEIFRR